VEELVRAVPEYGFDEDAAERPASDFQLGYTSLPLVF
jgi:hypothetical protein